MGTTGTLQAEPSSAQGMSPALRRLFNEMRCDSDRKANETRKLLGRLARINGGLQVLYELLDPEGDFEEALTYENPEDALESLVVLAGALLHDRESTTREKEVLRARNERLREENARLGQRVDLLEEERDVLEEEFRRRRRRGKYNPRSRRIKWRQIRKQKIKAWL